MQAPFPQSNDPLFSFNHFLMVLTILVPFFLFWWDSRRQNEKMHQANLEQNWKMHIQNQERLKEIETKLEPIWSWWNRIRNGET